MALIVPSALGILLGLYAIAESFDNLFVPPWAIIHALWGTVLSSSRLAVLCLLGVRLLLTSTCDSDCRSVLAGGLTVWRLCSDGVFEVLEPPQFGAGQRMERV